MRRRGLLAGVAAAGAAAAAGTASAQSEPLSYGDWFSDVGNFDGTEDMRGESEVTVTVGVNANGGSYGFGPAAVRVDPGTTVVFDWVSDNHNVLPQDQPDGADWSGQEAVKNTGFTYEFTFETEGLYTYYCDPHLSLGMKGAVVVGDAEVEAPATGGGGGIALPGGGVGSTMVLFTMSGLALAVASVFAAEFLAAIRRPVEGTTALPAGEGETAEAPESEPASVLGHDDFDPKGTAGLIVVYFLILVGMWVFTYFVEFLGRGPTVIG